MSIDILTIALAFVIFLIGSSLQSGFGFGMGPIVMAFLPMILPKDSAINDAVVIFLIIAIISNIILTIQYRKFINWKVLLPILIPTLLIATTISYFAVDVDTSIAYLALGFLLIALSIFFIALEQRIHIKPSPLNGSLVGVVGGVCGGFFALAGPAAALYFLPALDDKRQYIGTFQIYFLIINIANLIMRIIKGTLQMQNYPIIIVAVIALFIGIFIGTYIFKKINSKWLKLGVYILIGLNGLWIVLSHFLGI